jgi:tRNA (uracil-5-)-methyltransferase TRM9
MIRNNILDFAISIAVVHHFSTPDRRREAINEILRTVKEGGEVMIYVWALEQEKVMFILFTKELKKEI